MADDDIAIEYVPRPDIDDQTGDMAEGEPLFTREQMIGWLSMQGFPPGEFVKRIIIDIDSTGYMVGPLIDIEVFVKNEDGKRHLHPMSAEDEATETRRAVMIMRRLRMHWGWK